MLTLIWNEGATLECISVLLIPELALQEPGHIQMLSLNKGPHVKQEFYALAQTALLRFQDQDLQIIPVEGSLRIHRNNESCDLKAGMAVCRTFSGDLEVLAHRGVFHRKLLEAACRFCARWIRLDI
jgi:hypothetical protein